MKILFTIIYLLLAYTISFSQCIDDSHSPFENQGWISCTKSVSVIPERGETHWMQYDFGHLYHITSMDIWNHNTWGETQAGAKTIMIDYSLDDSTWNTVGPISIDQAPGSWKYTGMQDIDLGGIECRYLLLTVTENWDASVPCTGISEIRFDLGELINTTEEQFESALLYPNPTSNMITLEYEGLHKAVNISILNTVGQVVKQVPISSTNKFTVPITELKNELYYLSLTTENETLTKTFVKQ